ncbi:MAG: protein kinase [Planctomycetes bacterium]|nr:protein kinase [Planctomycetota bacterium]
MSDSRTCPSARELQHAAAGELPDEIAARIDAHLMECAACAQQTLTCGQLDTYVQLLRQPQAVDSDPADERIRELISRLLKAAPQVHPTRLTHNDQAASAETLEEELSGLLQPEKEAGQLGRLGEYRILKVLGAGGMGGVFLAEDSQLRRRVALKVMRPRAAAAPGAAERFLREARAAAALRHPRIITIYQVGQAAEVPFLAMEFLEGETLEERLIRQSPLPLPDALEIGRQIAEGLSAAHAKGLIHRDIKPANIWLEKTQSANRTDSLAIKILDFGLARSTEVESQLTHSGMILGTPSYMAPEQAGGEDVDGRADLFSLGCVLYRMTTGKLPFPGTKPMEILKALATVTPASPKALNPVIPNTLSDLIDQLLAKDRQHRLASAEEVAQRLAGIAAEPPRSAPESTAADAGDGPRGPHRKRWMLASMASAAVMLLAVVWIVIKDKDGHEVARHQLPEGGQAVISKEVDAFAPEAVSGKAPASAAHLATAGAESGIAAAMSLRLDPQLIPQSERFDWQPQELVAVLGTHRMHAWEAVNSLLFHPRGDFVIGFTESTPPQAWSTLDWTPISMSSESLDHSEFRSGSCNLFSPDGAWMVCRSGKYAVERGSDGQIAFRLLGKMPVPKFWKCEGVLSPDGHWMVMAGDPIGVLEVWDVSENVPRLVRKYDYPTQDKQVPFISSSADGRRIAIPVLNATSNIHEIVLWDIDWDGIDGPQLKRFGEPIPGRYVALSPDGQRLSCSQIDGTMSRLLDVSVSPPRVEREFDSGGLRRFSPDGNWLAISEDDVVIYRKTPSGWDEHFRLPTLDGQNRRLWFSPESKSLIIGDFYSGALHVWDMTTNPPAQRHPAPQYREIAFSPNGHWLAASGAGSFATWKLDSNQPKLAVEIPSKAYFAHGPSFSPDSRLVAADISGRKRVWNLESGTPNQVSNEDLSFIRFAPEGASVQSIANGAVVLQPWELTGQGRFKLKDETTVLATGGIGFSHGISQPLQSIRPKRDRYLTIDKTGSLHVRSLKEAGLSLFQFQLPDQQPPATFTLSNDDNLLVAFPGVGDGRAWDLTETPPREYQLKSPKTLQNPTCCLLTGDGNLCLVAHSRGIDIFDWSKEKLVRRIPYPGPILQMISHPDGLHVATANFNGTIYILRIPELAEHTAKPLDSHMNGETSSSVLPD